LELLKNAISQFYEKSVAGQPQEFFQKKEGSETFTTIPLSGNSATIMLEISSKSDSN